MKKELLKELNAGISNYLTLAYMLIVNPLILSQSGMNFGSTLTATALTAGIASILMGLIGKYPFVLGPGMGLNAYFAYSAVLSFEHTWEEALAACVASGFILLILNVLGIRAALFDIIPHSLRAAVSCGIGLFLAFIALQNLGFIAPDPATLVTVGSIDAKSTLALLGLISIAALLHFGYHNALFISILGIWGASLALGFTEWHGILSLPPDITPTFFKADLSAIIKPSLWNVIASMVFVSLFDITGGIIALGKQGGFFNSSGKLPRLKKTLFVDSIGTILGGFLGTSNLTIYLESSAGIAAGGRKGLTAIITGTLFILSIFFFPLIKSIPLFATSPILVIIGCFMLKEITTIDWEEATEYVPATMVLLIIPLSFSILDGIAVGALLYPIIKLVTGRNKDVHWGMWVLAGIFTFRYIIL